MLNEFPIIHNMRTHIITKPFHFSLRMERRHRREGSISSLRLHSLTTLPRCIYVFQFGVLEKNFKLQRTRRVQFSFRRDVPSDPKELQRLPRIGFRGVRGGTVVLLPPLQAVVTSSYARTL